MDEIDHIQEAASAAQEALLAERRRIAQLDAMAVAPLSRECNSCGFEIPQQRLRTLPRTRLCFECASDAERAAKRQ
jgi:RNA polymerase-binding transcription factor DksA